MPSSPCWPRQSLKDYLNGSTDDQRLSAIEDHLAQCQACEQTLLELEGDPDTLLVAVRQRFQEQPPEESQAKSASEPLTGPIQRAVQSARELPQPAMATGAPLEKLGQIRLQQIGAYQLVRPLGRGGMGLVMLAEHTSLKKKVAIKILPSLFGDRPELVRRFQREMVTAGQLNHASIVHTTDGGAEQGTHYLVMEYIDGLDLSRIARLGGPLPIADACELIRQTALGLSYAHAQGVVHRDIKPSNLMLDTAGRVKILDFGLAQLNLWDEAAVELTTVGQLMGTLDYMAPEQAERVGAVDHRADLYALGATLFRLLTGRAPLTAAPNMTLLEKVRLLGSHSPPSVSTLREDCPATLVQLIQQLLSRDPAQRPASAAHVAEALLPLCAGHNLPALLTRCREGAAAEPVMEDTPALRPLVAALPPSQPPRRSWLALAWLAPLAIGAAIFIVLETQKGQLVIQSEVAGVKVNVLQDGKVYQQLQVQPGAHSTRLFADKYTIEIDGASDEVAIDQSNVEIRRGSTVVARIKQASKANRTELELSSINKSIDAGDGQVKNPQTEAADKPTAPASSSVKATPGTNGLPGEAALRTGGDDISSKSQAAVASNQPADMQTAPLNTASREIESLELAAARAKLDQFQKEVDECKADLAQKTYEWEQVQTLFPKGLISELEYKNKLNSWAQANAKFEKAEAQATEFAIMFEAKKKDLESLNQPMYAGKALPQWLDVLERDLDTPTRLNTLPAIERLSKTADTGTIARINRALLSIINALARETSWGIDLHRRVPEDNQRLAGTLHSLVSINGTETAFQLLKDGCLLEEGRVSLSTIAILWNLSSWDLTHQAGEWLLSEGRFQSLDTAEAWAAFCFLEVLMNHRDADLFGRLPKVILDQPKLGLPALLLFEPAVIGGNEKKMEFLASPEVIQLEETIAKSAREAFLSDASSPQWVAMTAHWLARTTSDIEKHRAELVEKIRSRLQQLAADDDRLLAVVPEVVPSAPRTTKANGSGGNRQFWSHEPIQQNIGPLSLNPIGPDHRTRMSFIYTYSRSEMVCLLSLAVRLGAVRELDDAIAPVAERVFTKAWPLTATWAQGHNLIDAPNWPFREDEIKRLPDPYNKFSSSVWRAVKLAATIQSLDYATLFNTQLHALMLGNQADLIIVGRDKDADGMLSKAEASDYHSWRADFDKDQLISKEELIRYLQEKISLAYVRRRFGDFNLGFDGSLPRDGAIPGMSESQFAEIDVDSDDQLSLSELVTYGMAHPQPPSLDVPAYKQPGNPAVGTNATPDDVRMAWAQRMIAKYDKNKDGQLTADEWNMMIVKPKASTDANGDGIITLEELAAQR